MPNNYNLMIAPPRSGSTVLEKVLANSPSIDRDIHEPFMEFGRRNGDLSITRKKFYDSLKNAKNPLVKEMSHDIMKDYVYKDLFTGAKQPIILNIRNPLLCAESRIKAILEASKVSLRDSTKHFMFPQQPQSFFKSKTNQKLLDLYAIQKDYPDWNNYVISNVKNKNYLEFGDFLASDTERFMTGFGWEELGFLSDYAKKEGLNYIVVENTSFRKYPDSQTRKICKEIGIDYNPNMLVWENGAYAHIGTIWYSSINQSQSIKPPTENTPSLSAFPKKVRKYLLNSAFPVYKNLREAKI